VDDKFSWKEHIATVRKKCYRGLSQLRKLRDVLPVSTKVKLYNALVLPHTDYCSVVWHECGAVQQQQVERIQNYGMRLILAKPPRTPSSELRAYLKWTTLCRRHQMLRLNMMHRCLHNQAPGYLQSYFSTNGSVSKCQCITRGHSKVYLRSVRTEVGRNSFSFKGAQDWNQLPSHIRNISDFPQFKKRIKEHYIA